MPAPYFTPFSEPLDDILGRLINDIETWRFRLGIQRPINKNTDLSLDYLYTDRRSDIAADEYTENRVTLTIRFRV